MLKLYNSLSRKLENFEPINPPFVGFYVCGPTVYGDSHLGHARSYVVFDVLYRYLNHLGYKTRYVQNITDVGHLTDNADEGNDKIAAQAKLEKKSPVEIAYKYERTFFRDMQKLNILPPDISCRATGHIIEMIEHIQKLIEKKHAYVTEEGNVYFEVRSFKDYGKLSGRKLNESKSGERIHIADDKKNPEDFALWKKADTSHIMRWPSPWSTGYPGWHIECSVMSHKYIGETLDIHGGGMDNIFPHHECEIAQSESHTNKPFTKYFLHNNMLTVNGTKMGKSLGNFIILDEIFKQYDPMVLRFYILQSHYRSVLDFSNESLDAAKTGFERLKNSILALYAKAGTNTTDKNDTTINNLFSQFINAMNDDLNTPTAISLLYELLKISNTELNSSTPNIEKLSQLAEVVRTATHDILGISFNADGQASKEKELIELLIAQRKQYRDEKNFIMADVIRDQLEAIGITIKDGAQETTYTIR